MKHAPHHENSGREASRPPARPRVILIPGPVPEIAPGMLAGLAVETRVAPDLDTVDALLERFARTLVVADATCSDPGGMRVLERVHRRSPSAAVIIVSSHGNIGLAVDAVRSGAADFLPAPVPAATLAASVRRVLGGQVEQRSRAHLPASFTPLVGRSPRLLTLLDKAARAARSNANVLIEGETGTGKELLARAMHAGSPRASGGFQTVNCGGIPRELLESELFGYRRGAFTGAWADKPGLVELAEGGTLFLDEIGELPLDLQVRILRLIQSGEISKIGGTGQTRVDVRILSATHRNLKSMAERGEFREDLYYRLAVIVLDVPPLRERLEDVPELAARFFKASRARQRRPELILAPGAVARLQKHRWPGNLRELENVIERAVVLADGPLITDFELPDAGAEVTPVASADLLSQGVSLQEVERHLLEAAVHRAGGNAALAARLLGVTRKTLVCRMAKHGISAQQARKAD